MSEPEIPVTPTKPSRNDGASRWSSVCRKNQAYAIRIATDFGIPGRCFELFVFLWRRSLIRAIDCAE